ncbi:MAG: MerR family transcriptional regulator [Pseudomonadota bacterium]|nr:MerR family transcriptional regulator [Pseudomonadota bacterium]
MTIDAADVELPPIPGKRYFAIGEVSKLCDVKPHVLRYWEQEFPQLKPVKRRGNRRYYQRHEVELIRLIRKLLYIDGFTISGARNKLDELAAEEGGLEGAAAVADHGEIDHALIAQLAKELDEVAEMLR